MSLVEDCEVGLDRRRFTWDGTVCHDDGFSLGIVAGDDSSGVWEHLSHGETRC